SVRRHRDYSAGGHRAGSFYHWGLQSPNGNPRAGLYRRAYYGVALFAWGERLRDLCSRYLRSLDEAEPFRDLEQLSRLHPGVTFLSTLAANACDSGDGEPRLPCSRLWESGGGFLPRLLRFAKQSRTRI